jgi:hypothetical protein
MGFTNNMVKIKELIESSSSASFSSSSSEPYSLFLYAMNSPLTRDRYTTRLDRFFSFIGIEGTSIEERCRSFVERGNHDNDWVFRSIMRFIQIQKERAYRKEITGSTIRNYVKAIKLLFTEMNDILISWKKITRGLPKGRKWADDRAPTLEEIRKIVEYPDRRIKPIVYTMVSSGIRLGAWDYLRWGHIQPIYSNSEITAAKILVYAGEENKIIMLRKRNKKNKNSYHYLLKPTNSFPIERLH